MRRILVSPHLDDAVLSCFGALSTDAVVVTVFSDAPEDARLSDWDARCGATSSRELMARRRSEDDEALALTGARARRLAFREQAYGEPPPLTELSEALAAELSGADEVWLPAAIGGHPDHVRARAAGFAALAAAPTASVWLYAEYPYHQYLARALPSGDPVEALRDWYAERMGSDVKVTVQHLPASLIERKRAAVGCYASQLGALDATVGGRLLDADLLAAEYAWPLRAGR